MSCPRPRRARARRVRPAAQAGGSRPRRSTGRAPTRQGRRRRPGPRRHGRARLPQARGRRAARLPLARFAGGAWQAPERVDAGSPTERPTPRSPWATAHRVLLGPPAGGCSAARRAADGPGRSPRPPSSSTAEAGPADRPRRRHGHQRHRLRGWRAPPAPAAGTSASPQRRELRAHPAPLDIDPAGPQATARAARAWRSPRRATPSPCGARAGRSSAGGSSGSRPRSCPGRSLCPTSGVPGGAADSPEIDDRGRRLVRLGRVPAGPRRRLARARAPARGLAVRVDERARPRPGRRPRRASR